MAMGDMDCGDNSCVFAWKKGGMRTNGGCRCLQDLPHDQRRDINLWAQRARQEIRDAEQRGREAERADVKAYLAELELAEHKRMARGEESAHYHSRTMIGVGAHVGAAERGKDGE